MTLFRGLGLLAVALSTTTGVVNALPKENRSLNRFAETAVDQFAVHCSGEAAGVSDVDRQLRDDQTTESAQSSLLEWQARAVGNRT